MIRENQKIFNTAQMLLDILLFIVAMTGAFYIRFINYRGDHIEIEFYIKLSLISIPVYLLIYNYQQLYESYRSKRLILEISRVFKSNAAGIIFIFVLSFLIKEVNVSRMVILIFGVFNTSLMVLSRLVIRKALRRMRRKGYNIKRLLIIGHNHLAKDFCRRIIKNANLGFVLVGFLSNRYDDKRDPCLLDSVPYRGPFSHLEDVLKEDQIDEVIIALEYDQYNHLPEIIDSCEKAGTKVRVVPFYTKYLPAKPYIDEVEGLPVINIRRIPLDNLLNNWLKRSFDVLFSLFVVIMIAPLLLAIAIGVKATSPGPVLYKQERVGLNKKNFIMYKFRSMRVATDDSDKTAWSRKQDPRKTKFGSFIRKYSLDELPQFFNVIGGSMSLIGPRPEIPFHVDNFKHEIPLYMVKHQVRPGITGWAQVNGYRGDTSIKGRIEHDIFYIENWSFLFDMKILLMTIFKGMVNKSE